MDWSQAGLWLAVMASGLYHGANPGMGWPLAVAAGMFERSPRALVAALGYLAAGHMLAMLVAIVPFAVLATLLTWQHSIQVATSVLIIAFGCALLITRKHPRFLARIPPAQLGFWSFAIAIAHGAGLMLVPVYLGLCRSGATDITHAAAGALISSNLGMALIVSFMHTLAMLTAGGGLAWLVYRYLGLEFLSRSWFNLETVWAASLVLVGVLNLGLSIYGVH